MQARGLDLGSTVKGLVVRSIRAPVVECRHATGLQCTAWSASLLLHHPTRPPLDSHVVSERASSEGASCPDFRALDASFPCWESVSTFCCVG